MKKTISIILAFCILLTSFPVAVFAAPDDVVLNSVTITKTYKRVGTAAVLDKIVVNATGKNLDKATFRLEKADGTTQIIKLNPQAGDTFAETVLSGNAVNNLIGNELKISGQGLSEISYKLTENLPRFEYPTKPFKKDEPVILTGSNYNKLKSVSTGEVTTGNFFKSDANVEIKKTSVVSDDKISQVIGDKIQGQIGVSFKNTSKVNDISITSEHRYPGAVTVISDLNVSNVKFFPNRGPVLTEVTLSGKLMDEESLSIFFIPRGTDVYNFSAYDMKNMVKPSDEQYISNFQGTGEDRFKIKVPQGIDPNYYQIVLTNNVTSNPAQNINSLFLVETEYDAPIGDSPAYFYVTNTAFAQIVNMDPLEAAAGSNVKIEGIFLGSLSDDEFKTSKGYDIKVLEEPIDPNATSPQLTLSYLPKSGGDLGEYDFYGTKRKIKSIKRVITGDIGEPITFNTGASFTQSLDTLMLRLPSVHQGNEYENVNLYITTTITFEDDGDPNTLEDMELKDRAVIIPKNANWKKIDGNYKFRYLETMFTPEIDDGGIFPDRLPVDESNTLLENLEVYITGKNFVKYRYRNESGIEKVKYPLVDLGSQFIVNKNIEGATPANTWNNSFIEVYKDGKVVSGNKGDQEGDTIKIIIPAGVMIDPDQINNPSTIATVKNPIKNAEIITDNSRNFFGNATHKITFIQVPANKRPEITEIQPSAIVPAMEATKDLKIIGTNFDLDAEVYLDGEKISDAKRDPVNNIITFTAPAKPVGNYQIAVRNPESGAVGIFNYLTYIQTSTEGLEIINYQPKSGKKDDVINVSGKSFVPPDPTVADISGSGVWRIIGSRILLDGKDINEYISMDAQGNPMAYDFSPASNLVNFSGNAVSLSEDASGIFLEKGGKYFKLYFDYSTGKVLITDGQNEIYEINQSSGFSQTGSQLTANGNNFNIKTVYKNEDGKITGNKVSVKSNYELTFKVPSPPEFQPRLDNPYDLTVKNPDTRTFTVPDGFIILSPIVNPEITSITPNMVSEDGGIPMIIKGKNFINLGEGKKTVVIVDGVKVPAEQTIIGVNNDEIRITVPKYVPKGGAKSLAEEIKTDRKQVPIVVQNPDGGSARWSDFWYLVLKNRPVIAEVQPKTNENGTKELDIFGSGFIFYEPFTNNPGGNDDKWDEGEVFTDLNGNGKWDSFSNSSDPEFKNILEQFVSQLKTLPENEGKSDEELRKEAWDKFISPVTPEVYFRSEDGRDVKKGNIIAFSPTQITVSLPDMKTGKAFVYLINNDKSSSNEVGFEFVLKEPVITETVPPFGNKKGGDEIQITGSNFKDSSINYVNAGMDVTKSSMPLVRFGSLADKNMSNRSTAIDEPNSGKITGTSGKVNVGGLEVKYDSAVKPSKLSFDLDANGTHYTGEMNYDTSLGAVFLPLSNLRDPSGASFISNEMVRVEVARDSGNTSSYRIFVDRGYAKTAKLSPTGISVITPESYKIGNTDLTVYINDRREGSASTTFKYTNPNSFPKIFNVLKDEKEGKLGKDSDGKDIKIITVTPKGGNLIRVIGEDFRNPSTIQFVGFNNVKVGDIKYEKPGNNSNYSELTFTMPALGEGAVGKLIPLVVLTGDNYASSKDATPPIYFQVVSSESPELSIISVAPNKGPEEGGTEIIIKGSDFRPTMEDFPGEKLSVIFERDGKMVEVTNFITVTHDTIRLLTPSFTAGPVNIKVKNPDGNIVTLENAFTYTSAPKILDVLDQENPEQKIDMLSVEGGEKITIVGTGFQEGATVLFAPVLTEITDIVKTDDKSIVINKNGKLYLATDFQEGQDVTFVDGSHINVTTPPGTKDREGILVVNPDGGVSNLYPLKYGIPEIQAPTKVAAEVIFGTSIRVSWMGVRNAVEYEVYVSENGKGYEFLGSTKDTVYLWKNPKPNTTYKFQVRAMGTFGTSKPLEVSESNEVRTWEIKEQPDKDGKILEKTVMKKSGIKGEVIIGNDFNIQGLKIDLVKGNMKGVKNLKLRIPAKVIDEGLGDIKIFGDKYSITFNPKIFNNAQIKGASGDPQSGVVLDISPYKKNDLSKYTINKMSEPMSLSATQYIGKEKTAMKKLSGEFIMKMDYDKLTQKAKKYKWVALTIYDATKKLFLVPEKIDELGIYMMLGGRK